MISCELICQEQHTMPGTFQSISNLRDLCDVIGNRDCSATDARKDREIARRCQIGTKHSPPSNLQFNSEQGVLYLRRWTPCCYRKFVRSSAHLQDSLPIDSGQPCFAHCLLDFVPQVRRRNAHLYRMESEVVGLALNALITRPGKMPR